EVVVLPAQQEQADECRDGAGPNAAAQHDAPLAARGGLYARRPALDQRLLLAPLRHARLRLGVLGDGRGGDRGAEGVQKRVEGLVADDDLREVEEQTAGLVDAR